MKICPRCSELLPDDAKFCPHDGEGLAKNTDRFLGRTIASRYRLIRRLGSGGMSVVYLARHELISRLSAIKILRPELSLIAEHRERFLREARAVNRINHPNIVEITDVGESDGVAYLVMEYVEGESLLAQIQRGRLPWPRSCRVALQVASALARAHQMGVIHRDLKPENIMLLPRGESGTELVKLTDFGIAKVLGEPTLTLNEQLFGTPGYIAPEYVGGTGVEGRSDIYSLAVVLYEMVTGALPFEGRGQSDLLLKPLTSAPIPPSRRVSDLPPDLESLILRCLAREPKDRPHDAFAVHDALVDILRRYGSGTRPASGGTGGGGATAPLVPPGGSVAPGAGGAAPTGDVIGREPIETIVDHVSAASTAGRDTANVGKIVTREMSSRWHAALADLEALISKARKKGGASARAAQAAAELAMVAGEMVPRVERAAKMVGELQAKTDRLEASGREFRTNLGHAIDVLVHDRSRERAHLDALRARRQALERAVHGGGIPSSNDPQAGTEPMAPPAMSAATPYSAPPAHPSAARSPMSTGQPMSADPRVWEIEALKDEEHRAEKVVLDLGYQLDALQTQLDTKNEDFERELVAATGSLEGSLSALRRLTNEIVRTIDDGIGILQRTA